jgi:hypothetical protein
VAVLGGNVHAFVSPMVEDAINEKLGSK